jgi:hypothetical protein
MARRTKRKKSTGGAKAKISGPNSPEQPEVMAVAPASGPDSPEQPQALRAMASGPDSPEQPQ